MVQKLNLIAYGKFLPYFLLIKLTANLRKTAAYSIDKLVIQPPIQGLIYNGIMLLKSITRILTKYIKHMRKNFFPEIMICSPLKQVAKFFLCCLLLLILQNV